MVPVPTARKIVKKFSKIFHNKNVQVALIIVIGVLTIPLTVLALHYNTTNQQHASTIQNWCNSNTPANAEGICGNHGWGYCTTSSGCNTQYFTYSGATNGSACRGYDDNSGCCYPKTTPAPVNGTTNNAGECSNGGTGMCTGLGNYQGMNTNNHVTKYLFTQLSNTVQACNAYFYKALGVAAGTESKFISQDGQYYGCSYLDPSVNRRAQISCNSAPPPTNATPCTSLSGYCAVGDSSACGSNKYIYSGGWCGSGKVCCGPNLNPAPVGNVDGASCTSNGVVGWTCDASDYNQALRVDFYLDGQAGTGGTGLGSTTADTVRESAVGGQCGGNVNHGFQWTLPSSVLDGKKHIIYAYGINTPSDPTHNTLLNPSGTSFTCAPVINISPSPALVTPSVTPTATPTPLSAKAKPTYLNIAVILSGIGMKGNLHPVDQTRIGHASIYAKDVDPTQPNVSPIYDNNNIVLRYNSQTGYFTNTQVNLGSKWATGDYQVFIKVNGYFRKYIIPSNASGNTITITAGITNDLPFVTLLPGDTVPLYNELDLGDFYAIVGCYTDKAATASCSAGSKITDLNDDGVVDGIDLNLWLQTASQLEANGILPGKGDGPISN